MIFSGDDREPAAPLLMSPMDPDRLLDEAREGSLDAFTEIVRLHQGRVRAYLNRFIRGRDVVDDLAQDVFLTAYRSLGSFRGDAPLAVWLLGIARHRALMMLREEQRRRAREEASLERSLAGWRAGRAEREGDRSGELSALEGCMDALPPEHAKLVAEHYFGERPLVEMARASGRKESALRMALLRARQALRLCVEGRLA